MIKRIQFVLLVLATLLISCSNDDDNQSDSLKVGKTLVAFNVEGGEEELIVKSSRIGDLMWEISDDIDWLTIRRSKNVFRIIADPNYTSSAREAVLLLRLDEAVSEVKITQSTVSIDAEVELIGLENSSEEKEVKVSSSIEYTVEASETWCNVSKTKTGIKVSVDPNYSLQKRTSEILFSFDGNVCKSIKVEQAEAPWYESFEMILVEGGTFMMGAQSSDENGTNYDENATSIESPIRKVNLSDFYIAKFEVTQEQWVAAMGENPSAYLGDKYPVESISWNKVQEFITILNEKTGLFYRLPTESEWEYAALGGNKSKGTIYSGDSFIFNVGWYYSNSDHTTHAVGDKDANELFLHDMTGNVGEWCQDYFGYYPSSEESDPSGPTTGAKRIVRGGSWNNSYKECRIKYRDRLMPDEANDNIGFRLVISK